MIEAKTCETVQMQRPRITHGKFEHLCAFFISRIENQLQLYSLLFLLGTFWKPFDRVSYQMFKLVNVD